MTATNDERREVARRLREYEVAGSPIWYHVANAFGVPLTMEGRRFLDLVADLIEPEPERTCRNTVDWDGGFSCSECGFGCDTEDAHIGDQSYCGGFEFCPNCGAKVVGK